jgi:hypothetical protein
MTCTAYLDWNIFNKLENTVTLKAEETVVYTAIETSILEGNVLVPYSNAHISDLARGYLKNPAFTEGHLHNINRLTNNFCIVQYWGEQKVKWHVRDPHEFLNSTLDESEITAGSFADLLYLEDEPVMNALWDLQKSLLRRQPVHPSFQDIYAFDPIFKTLFPRTKEEMNVLALCEDLFQFGSRIKSDYALYKHFQKFLTQLRLKLPQYQRLYAKTQQKVIGKPLYLNWAEMVDKAIEDVRHKSPNAAYDKIFNLFTGYDLKGYHTDERFSNLIDDALHCFYSAHCDYFVTIDKRCSAKAKKVFEQLKLRTKVVTPYELIDLIK